MSFITDNSSFSEEGGPVDEIGIVPLVIVVGVGIVVGGTERFVFMVGLIIVVFVVEGITFENLLQSLV